MFINLITFFLSMFADMTSDLSSINLAFNSNVIDAISNIWGIVCWLIPLRELVPLLLAIIALHMFKAVIALIKTIWNLIPFL